MKGASKGGYTIVEVLIVIAVTSAIFLSITRLFSGQTGDAVYAQTMQDLSSKIRTFSNQVNSNSFPDTSGYSCTVAGGTVTLTADSTSQLGTSKDCIFLGRALKVEVGSKTVYSYVVLSPRNVWTGGVDTGVPVSSFSQAKPTPAWYNSNLILVDTYDLEGGSQITYSRISGQGTAQYSLMGIYGNLESSASSVSGTPPLIMMGYPLASPSTSASIKSCIEANAPCSSGLIVNTAQWQLCVQTGDGRSAKLTINSTPSGLNNVIDYTTCP